MAKSMPRSLNWRRRVLTLAALAAAASPLLSGCGSSGAVAGDSGAPADGTTMVADAPLDDVAPPDGPADVGSAESGNEAAEAAAVDAGDASGGCAPPLQVRVSVATSEANLVVSPDGSECTVTAPSTPDAVLTYEDIGTGAGDFPFGEVWVPTGSSWHISTPDGGLVGQGMTYALKFRCFDPPAPIKTALLLTNGAGAMLSLNVGCQSSGLVFVVYDVSFTSGGAPGDASPE
jgi:hypothetical protein